jgi:hypothetical protein
MAQAARFHDREPGLQEPYRALLVQQRRDDPNSAV